MPVVYNGQSVENIVYDDGEGTVVRPIRVLYNDEQVFRLMPNLYDGDAAILKGWGDYTLLCGQSDTRMDLQWNTNGNLEGLSGTVNKKIYWFRAVSGGHFQFAKTSFTEPDESDWSMLFGFVYSSATGEISVHPGNGNHDYVGGGLHLWCYNNGLVFVYTGDESDAGDPSHMIEDTIIKCSLGTPE